MIGPLQSLVPEFLNGLGLCSTDLATSVHFTDTTTQRSATSARLIPASSSYTQVQLTLPTNHSCYELPSFVVPTLEPTAAWPARVTLQSPTTIQHQQPNIALRQQYTNGQITLQRSSWLLVAQPSSTQPGDCDRSVRAVRPPRGEEILPPSAAPDEPVPGTRRRDGWADECRRGCTAYWWNFEFAIRRTELTSE